MATRIEEILGKDINSLKELREEIKRLQDSIANVDPTTQQFKDTTTKLAAAQEQLTSVTRGSKDGIDVAKDSIVGMEREYKNLYNTYKMLTEEQRNSDFGKEMASSLNTLSTKLNDTKKGVGNFKDNIGRYTDSIIGAFQKMGGSLGALANPLKTAKKGIEGFNTALKANPIGLIVGAIQLFITVVKKMKEAISQNEELQMRWNQAMSAFKPIADAMANAVQKIAEQFVKFVEKIADAIRWIREAKAAVTDFLGLTKGAKKAVQEQNKVYQDIAKSQNQLILNKREYQKLNAQDKAIVEQLREEASETTNLQEKKELLEQAKEKQAEIDARNLELAQEELRILEEQSKLTANSAADNEKLAAAVAAVSEAEAQAAANARLFNKQLASTEKSLGGGSGGGGGVTGAASKAKSEVDELRESTKKLYDELIEDSKSTYQKLTEEFQKNFKNFKKFGLDTTLLEKKYKEALQKLFEDTANAAADAASKAYVNATKDRLSGYDSVLADAIQDEVEQSFMDLEKMKAKSKVFDEFYNNFLSFDPAMEGIQDDMKRFVEEINEVLGTNLHFPPATDADSMAKFRESLDKVKVLFEKTINQMKASAEKADIERAMIFGAGGEESLLDNRINAVRFRNPVYDDYEEQMTKIRRDELVNMRQHYSRIMQLENLSDEERLEAKQNYYAAISELREMEMEAEILQQERNAEIMEAAFDRYLDIANAIDTVTNAVSNLIQAQLNDGKITEEQAKKKKKTLIALEKVALAVNIAQIAASTAAGIMDVWKGYATETAANAVAAAATGPAAPATLATLNAKSLVAATLKTTGLAAMGAANIAAATMGTISKVNSLKGGDSGGGTETAVANIAEIDSTPYSYSRQLQTAEEYDNTYNKEYYVSVTDINNVQNRVKVRENESSF